MEPESSLPRLQLPATCPYPEPEILPFTSLSKYFAEVPTYTLVQFIILGYAVSSFMSTNFYSKKFILLLFFGKIKKYVFNVLHT